MLLMSYQSQQQQQVAQQNENVLGQVLNLLNGLTQQQTPGPIVPEDMKASIKLILNRHFHDHTAREYATEIPWDKLSARFGDIMNAYTPDQTRYYRLEVNKIFRNIRDAFVKKIHGRYNVKVPIPNMKLKSYARYIFGRDKVLTDSVLRRAAVMRKVRDMPGNKPYYEKLKNELKRIESLGEEAAGQELERIVAQDETENQVEIDERVVVDEPDL
ncbi:hypothetical protein HDU79_009619 [Rhizoclosmatium sp. JEL0117]|nr:hypothetical protein HDU79_009619 [Rhizoclosmatium sp. JEL0117]